MPASLVEPIPGWNRLQTRKEPDPESPSSISRKEPNSYSGADSRPESLTPLVGIDFSIRGMSLYGEEFVLNVDISPWILPILAVPHLKLRI